MGVEVSHELLLRVLALVTKFRQLAACCGLTLIVCESP